MDEKQISQLLERYLQGKCTPEEKLLVEEAYLDQLKSPDHQFQFELDYKAKQKEIWNLLNPEPAKQVVTLWPRISIAAAILVIISLSILFFKPSHVGTKQYSSIKPGTNKAILTLGNGRQINLSNASNGVLASSGAASIHKSKNGLVSYDLAGPKPGSSAIVYNTLTTPRGGNYTITLTDGTKVWLNAASSLRFPTTFSGKERKVELTGEAYFEVAKNKHQPFKVYSENQVVEVLGTHFDVNAYNDDHNIKTTLLEGSVKVSSPKGNIVIKPGEQSLLSNTNGLLTVNNNIDTDDVIAWKNGLFVFDNANIEKVMIQISRWYNANVVYSGDPNKLTFSGVMPKADNIDEVFKVLEKAGGVKFSTVGNQINVIITNNIK